MANVSWDLKEIDLHQLKEENLQLLCLQVGGDKDFDSIHTINFYLNFLFLFKIYHLMLLINKFINLEVLIKKIKIRI